VHYNTPRPAGRVSFWYAVFGTGLCGLALTVPGLIWPDFGLELVAVALDWALTVLVPSLVLSIAYVVSQ